MNLGKERYVLRLQCTGGLIVGKFWEPSVSLQPLLKSPRNLRGSSLVTPKKCVRVRLSFAAFTQAALNLRAPVIELAQFSLKFYDLFLRPFLPVPFVLLA